MDRAKYMLNPEHAVSCCFFRGIIAKILGQSLMLMELIRKEMTPKSMWASHCRGGQNVIINTKTTWYEVRRCVYTLVLLSSHTSGHIYT